MSSTLKSPQEDNFCAQRADANRPLITVGVPVFNGERFLARAIESVRAQSVADFELVVADNASVDGTEAIGRAYAGRDARIRYLRHHQNFGVVYNWNCVVHAARGVYFMWLSCNDYLAPEALRRCIDVLQADMRAVLSFGERCFINAAGEVVGADTSPELADEDPVERFKMMCWPVPWVHPISGGLIRRDLLLKTALMRAFPGSDLPLFAELALLGMFRRIPTVLVYETVGKGYATAHRTRSEIDKMFNPNLRWSYKLNRFRFHLAYIATIVRAELAWRRKLHGVREVLRRMGWDRRLLAIDLLRCFGLGQRR